MKFLVSLLFFMATASYAATYTCETVEVTPEGLKPGFLEEVIISDGEVALHFQDGSQSLYHVDPDQYEEAGRAVSGIAVIAPLDPHNSLEANFEDKISFEIYEEADPMLGYGIIALGYDSSTYAFATCQSDS